MKDVAGNGDQNRAPSILNKTQLDKHPMSIMKRFTGKTVVVTGASRGIGLGIAERFAEEGANLVLADRDPRVEEAAATIKRFGVGALPAVCDVTNKAEVEDLYKRAAGQFGTIDISIQNAGIITINKLEDLTEA